MNNVNASRAPAQAGGRLAACFARLRTQGRKALVAYLTAGDPDFETSIAAAHAAIAGGADVLEVGVPFSDPVADGPVIQRAMLRALAGGGGLDAALELVRRLRERHADTPVVLFGYANPLLWGGLDATCVRIAAAGCDGMLVVDVPTEEAAPFRAAAAEHGLDWVPLIAPTTGIERAKTIARDATGFIYMVSMMGVTGGKLEDPSHLSPSVAAIRAVTQAPICLGFGVRDRDSARLAAAVADGVVVGSAIVAVLETPASAGGGPAGVTRLVQQLREGADAAG